jgi:hypothetical protein
MSPPRPPGSAIARLATFWVGARAFARQHPVHTHVQLRPGEEAADESPNPGDIGYGFDNNDNPTAITRNGLTTTISYDQLNRRSLQTLPSGVTTNWYYDAHGFVNLILSNNGNLDGHGYTRDAVTGDPLSSTNALGQRWYMRILFGCSL